MSKLIQRKLKRRTLYKTINLEGVHDKQLSWRAKGLLVYLLSRPADWNLNYRDLIGRSADGRKSVRSAVQELKQHGYLVAQPIRSSRNEFNGWRWYVTESPKELPISGNTLSGKVQSGESRATGNARNAQGSKEGVLETRSTRKEGTSFPAPDVGGGASVEAAGDGGAQTASACGDANTQPCVSMNTQPSTFPTAWYLECLDAYEVLKAITLGEPEKQPLRRELKTIFQAGHDAQAVLSFMTWLARNDWPNWRLYTVRARIAEWKANQLKAPHEIEGRKPQAQAQTINDAMDELQSFVDGNET